MIQKIELSAALNSLATQSNIDKVTGMLGSSAANISKADLATVVAGLIKKIGGLLYTNYITGKSSKENQTQLAKEVVDALPTQERLVFAIIHQYAGERLVFGYYYDYKAYGTINVYQADNTHFRVDIRNNEYILR